MNTFEQLSLAYGASEIGLALVRRSRRTDAQSHDRGTLWLVWLVIGTAIALSITVSKRLEFGHYTRADWATNVGYGIFALGIGLRWWAIVVLGRFFTVDVAIHAGHELVQRGPYRVLRHPSYTGALLSFVGLGLFFDSWPALVVVTLPLLAVLLWRIRVEELALAGHFGEVWRAHCARTWRLVPGVW